MITGIVTADGIPMLSLSMAGKNWDAIVDTGFNGDMELPEDLKPNLHLHYVGKATSALGGGYVIEEDVYLTDIQFESQTITVEITFAPVNHILLGTSLLKPYSLYINFANKTLKLTKEN